MSPRESHRAPRRARAEDALLAALRWYFGVVFAREEGPGALPFYCDPARVGAFATDPEALARGDEAALFKLFVALSMFQALRDVVILRLQRALPVGEALALSDLDTLARSAGEHPCEALCSAATFDARCDVWKRGTTVDCHQRPGEACHVKDATRSYRRMGDLGKLPTSAWLHHWRDGGLSVIVREVCAREARPEARADLLVERLARVHRVGRKLATLYVSALSTPSLAPGLTPWWPEIDGESLVVVDTNVARAVDALRPRGSPRTYEARARWLRARARRVDLRALHPAAPERSPRLLQQALYAFCSRSNRVARGDPCATGEAPCEGCAPSLCPFVRESAR